MPPTIDNNEIVISFKTKKLNSGDIVAIYHGNKLLVKRCIAGPAEWVNIDSEGNVSVIGQILEEPYISEKNIGTCDITLPYQVPED